MGMLCSLEVTCDDASGETPLLVKLGHVLSFQTCVIIGVFSGLVFDELRNFETPLHACGITVKV